jgi:hypothetical protein
LIASPLPLLVRRFLPILAVVWLAVPAAAFADGRRVIRDCTDDGRLQGHYSQSEYRDALAHMPTDVNEYTDCRDVIRRAQLASAAGSGSSKGGSSSGGSAPVSQPPAPAAGTDPLAAATPTERTGVKKALAGGSGAVKVEHSFVRPGALGTGTSRAFSDIPTPLLIVLVLLGTGALALVGARVRGRVIARRDT